MIKKHVKTITCLGNRLEMIIIFAIHFGDIHNEVLKSMGGKIIDRFRTPFDMTQNEGDCGIAKIPSSSNNT